MEKISYSEDALEYIAKIADGGMRDAITLLDKCLAYSTELTLENVVKTLGTVDYLVMMDLTDAIITNGNEKIIEIIEDIHNDGKDIKQFIKQYGHFLLDVQKYIIGCDWAYINIPRLSEYESWLNKHKDNLSIQSLLDTVIRLNSDIKYSATAKLDVEASLLLFKGEN